MVQLQEQRLFTASLTSGESRSRWLNLLNLLQKYSKPQQKNGEHLL